MSEFKKYRRKSISELRPYIVGEELLLAGVSISKPDMDNGSPKEGDMIARNPKNHDDKWLVSAEYVKDNLEVFIGNEQETPAKTLGNTSISKAKDNVSDLVVFGNGDVWQLLVKASSKREGWFKSSKALQVSSGCLVQVTTQQKNPDGSYVIAEAVTFVPGVYVVVNKDKDGKTVGRTLVTRPQAI